MTMVVGLTGGIATGKSTVAQMFVDEGIPVIDTDTIARDLLHKGTDPHAAVVDAFGKDILLTDGQINRKMLGRIIFGDPNKRKTLNDIVHPHVLRIVETEIERYTELGQPLVVVDVPLLFESGFDEVCDKTVVVYTSPEQQLKRLIERDVIQSEYAQMKIAAQMSVEEKAERADFVIDNSFSILQTKKDFVKILKELEVR